jgi:hypothetical protein
METKKTTSEKTADTKKKSKLLRWLTWIAGGFAGIVLAILFATPMLLSSSGGTRFLLGKINNSVDGQVGMDDFSVGWFSGVKLTNLTYESGDGATQVKVGRIETQPKVAALIGGRIDLGKTVIEQPQILLKVSSPTEKETSSTPGSSKGGSGSEPLVIPLHKINLEVLNGKATIELKDTDSQVRRVTFKNIASTVEMNDPGTESRLNLSLDVANGQEAGTLKAEGAVTPSTKGWTLEDTSGSFAVTISKLDLEGLRPLLALAGQDVQMGGVLNADATVQITKGNLETVKANAAVTNFSQGMGEQKMSFAEPVTLSAQVGMKDNTIKIDTLNVKAPFCTVECSGGTELLDYSITADLAKTQAFVGQFSDLGGYGMAGQLAVSGKLDLGEEKVATAGKGTVKNLLLSKDKDKAPQTDVTLDYNVAMDNKKQLLNVASLTLTTLPGTVSARNVSVPIGQSEGIPPITLNAQANLDMGKAWPYAQILGGAPSDIALAGVLDAAVSVETKDDIMRVKTDKTSIKKLKVAKPDSEPFEQDEVRLTADVTLDMVKQSIGVQAFDMQSAKGETLIKVTKGKVEQSSKDGIKTMGGEVEAEYDLTTLSTMASAFMPEGLKVQGKRKDRFEFSSQWPEAEPDKMMANLNAKGALGFDKANYLGLNFGPTELTLNVKQGQAAIDIPDADVNGGKVRFAGDINLAEKPMMLKLRKPAQVIENVRIDDVMSANLLQYLNPVFAKSTGVTGTANLSCSTLAIPLGSGTPKDINLAGNVGLTNVRLNSPLLGLIKSALRTEGLDLFSVPSTAFTVKDGTVAYSNMPMTFGSSYTMRFSGAIGLDKRLKMDVEVPVKDRTYVLPLTNSLDKPELDISRLALSNITDQIPVKDEKTKDAVEKGLQLFEEILKQGQKK